MIRQLRWRPILKTPISPRWPVKDLKCHANLLWSGSNVFRLNGKITRCLITHLLSGFQPLYQQLAVIVLFLWEVWHATLGVAFGIVFSVSRTKFHETRTSLFTLSFFFHALPPLLWLHCLLSKRLLPFSPWGVVCFHLAFSIWGA